MKQERDSVIPAKVGIQSDKGSLKNWILDQVQDDKILEDVLNFLSPLSNRSSAGIFFDGKRNKSESHGSVLY